MKATLSKKAEASRSVLLQLQMTRKSVASGSAIADPLALGMEEYDDRVTISVNIADGGNKPVRDACIERANDRLDEVCLAHVDRAGSRISNRLPRCVLRLIVIETSGSVLSGIEACLNCGHRNREYMESGSSV